MNDLGPSPDPRDLEALRAGSPIDPGAKHRVRARLAAVVPSVAAPAASRVRGGSAPRVVRAVSAGTYRVALASFLAGGVVGAALHARWSASVAPRAVLVDRPVAVSVDPPAPSPAPEAVRVAAPPPVTPEAARQTAPPPHVATSQLSAERRILDDARAALLRGEAQQALEALERHRRTFAAPLLGEERDALQVQALVKAERYAEARVRGEAFRRRLPDSFYLPMVDSALASIP